MAYKANNFSITSIRTALTGGVSIIIILTSGLVGTISIWGGLDSAIKLTRRNQAIKTSELSKELKNFEESIIREASTLSQVIGRSAEKLEEKEIIDILSAYSEHKESLTSITLVRKNRTMYGLVGGGVMSFMRSIPNLMMSHGRLHLMPYLMMSGKVLMIYI